MKIVGLLLAAILMPLAAQEIKLPASLEKLAAKAEETVDVTLDSSMLKVAGQFLSGKTEDEARIKKALSGIESIAVRSFAFSSEGQYDVADVDAIRAQVKRAPWSRIAGVTSKGDGENVDVYFKDGGNGALGGMLLICAEPRELTVVSVTGNLDPAQLADLGGHFAIPKLDVSASRGGKKEAQ